jgi:hypothetical protein
MMPVIGKKTVWSEESLRRRVQAIGYYLCKVMGYRDDYWYLLRKSDLKAKTLFRGEEGDEYISLGAMADVDSVSGVIDYIESQQKLRKAQLDEEGDDDA